MKTRPRSPTLKILLVEDEQDLRDTLQELLSDEGHDVVTAVDGEQALARLNSEAFNLVLADIRLPKVDGLTLFKRLKEESAPVEVILMTGNADVSQAVAAMKDGVYEYLIKPFDTDELLIQLTRLASKLAMERELDDARAKLGRAEESEGLLARSKEMRKLLTRVKAVAQSSAAALVTGESGTGKELVARLLHTQGPRAAQPFVVINCGALSQNLIEAEMFGHERGAFTGADRKRDGRFKAADKGTIFLDEIAELPMPAQAKLLRVLQEGTFEPLGSNATVKVDVRVVSATHRDLRQRVKEGQFREDLYYRINVVELTLPPLRDRVGDMPLLVSHFLQRFAPTGATPSISPEAWAMLMQHEFPGNVRELSHAIQHAVVLSGPSRSIGVEHLPANIMRTSFAAVATPTSGAGVNTLAEAVASFERQFVLAALAKSAWDPAAASASLGVTPDVLQEKVEHFGLRRDA